jgi:hypothetical protein
MAVNISAPGKAQMVRGANDGDHVGAPIRAH